MYIRTSLNVPIAIKTSFVRNFTRALIHHYLVTLYLLDIPSIISNESSGVGHAPLRLSRDVLSRESAEGMPYRHILGIA